VFNGGGAALPKSMHASLTYKKRGFYWLE